MLESIGPSIDPWIPLVTGLQLDFIPLITTVQAQQFSLFAVHLAVLLICSVIHQFVNEGVMGDGVQSLAKVNINKHPHSSLICPATFLITEGYQIDIAELILDMKLQLPCMIELDTET